jgi:acetyltransferase-like isoleucine patch superfamily enzyme
MSDPRTDGVVIVEHTPRSAGALVVKRIVQLAFGLWIVPRLCILWAAERVIGAQAFLHASESIGRVPGLWGVYCRAAFYRRTLSACSNNIYVGWLSTFSMREAKVGNGVYIGRRCSIGFADIGDHVMFADGVQILSGGREHGMSDTEGETHQDTPREFRRVTIGEGAWLGTNAVVMADVGAHAIVGAGAVVTKPVPDRCVVAGIPAKVIKDNREASPSTDAA